MIPLFKKIGIIGGAGPIASCLLYEKIIESCQQTYQCKNDADFPEIWLVSYPFDQMILGQDARDNKSTITTQLQACFDGLKANDVNIIGIACNTLHSFLPCLPQMQKSCVNMIAQVKKIAKKQQANNIVVLGTETTLQSGIYDIAEKTIHLPKQDQQEITAIIERILAGIIQENDVTTINKILQDTYRQNPFDTVLLGCTELSVLHQREAPIGIQNVRTIDSLSVLAQALVESAIIPTTLV